jgi:hypothetical protein
MTSHTRRLQNLRSSASSTWLKLRHFSKRHRNKILLVLSVIMLVLAVILVSTLVNETFKPYFNCAYLIDRPLNTDTLCTGFAIPTRDITLFPSLPKEDIDLKFLVIRKGIIPGVTLPENLIPLLPALSPINKPLEALRRFIAWNIILAFAVASLVMAFIAVKFKAFINLLRTPEGRKAILTNLNLWLLVFALFCSLFYFNFVANR